MSKSPYSLYAWTSVTLPPFNPLRPTQSDATNRLRCVSITDDADFVLTGSLDTEAVIRIWSVVPHGRISLYTKLGPMVGATRSLSLAYSSNNEMRYLAVVTDCGWLYVWDINISTLKKHKMKNDHQNEFAEIDPILIINGTEDPIGPFSRAVFLQDGKTLICCGLLPNQSFRFINCQTGVLLATAPSINCEIRETSKVDHLHKSTKLTIWNYTSLRLDHETTNANVNDVIQSGRWVALSDVSGCLVTLFISDFILNRINSNRDQHTCIRLSYNEILASGRRLCELPTTIFDLSFRTNKRTAGPVVSLAASDGLIRHWNIEKNRVQFAKGTTGNDPSEIRFIEYVKGNEKDEIDCQPAVVTAVNYKQRGGPKMSFANREFNEVSVIGVSGVTKDEDLKYTPEANENSFFHTLYWPGVQREPTCITSHRSLISGMHTSSDLKFLVSVSLEGVIQIFKFDKKINKNKKSPTLDKSPKRQKQQL